MGEGIQKSMDNMVVRIGELEKTVAALEAENERLWNSAVNMGCDCGSFGYPDPREHDENCWYVWFAQDVAARRQKAALKEAEDG